MARPDSELPADTGRRRFLEGAAAVLGASLLPLNWPLLVRTAEAAGQAAASAAPFQHLGVAEAADLEAMAARIIPSGETPGAREAGVIHFIDQAIGGFMAPAAAGLRAGLAAMNESVAMLHDGLRFVELDAAAQDAALVEIQDGEFFGLVRFLTLAGFLCLPSQGGNRDAVGWKLIGFDHRHAWAPPFGHYDAGVPETRSGVHD